MKKVTNYNNYEGRNGKREPRKMIRVHRKNHSILRNLNSNFHIQSNYINI